MYLNVPCNHTCAVMQCKSAFFNKSTPLVQHSEVTAYHVQNYTSLHYVLLHWSASIKALKVEAGFLIPTKQNACVCTCNKKRKTETAPEVSLLQRLLKQWLGDTDNHSRYVFMYCCKLEELLWSKKLPMHVIRKSTPLFFSENVFQVKGQEKPQFQRRIEQWCHQIGDKQRRQLAVCTCSNVK